MQSLGDFSEPKLPALLDVLTKHFQEAAAASEAAGDGEGAGEPASTRAIVFCSYRAMVAKLVDALKQHDPLIRARYGFAGQAWPMYHVWGSSLPHHLGSADLNGIYDRKQYLVGSLMHVGLVGRLCS